MDLSAVFERVVVINLDSRSDRWEQFLKRLPADWPFRAPERVTAIDARLAPPPEWWTWHRGGWGCYRTHLRLIETCLNSNIESILIFEDDAVFADDFTVQAARFFEHLPNDWSFLYLGGEHLELDGGVPKKIDDFIYRPWNVNRTHAFALRGKDFMQRVYRHLNATRSWKEHAHIDHHLGELHKQMKSGLYVPPHWIVGQEEGSSDVTDNYVPVRFFRGAEAIVSARPVLPMVAVLGPFGSGTTCLAGMLHHAGINMGYDFKANADEPHYEAPHLARICRNSYLEPWLTEQNAASDRIALLRLFAADHTSAVHGQSTLAGGHHPTLSLMGPELMDAWCSPFFVIATREPQESIRAVAELGWAWPTGALESVIPRMQSAIDLFLDRHTPKYLTVQYDQLLRDPATVLRAVCGFVGHTPSSEQHSCALAAVARTVDSDSNTGRSTGSLSRDHTAVPFDELVGDVVASARHEPDSAKYHLAGGDDRAGSASVADIWHQHLHQGLGNRLKGIVSLLRVAQLWPKPLSFYWTADDHLLSGCRFQDLFTNELTWTDAPEPVRVPYGLEYWRLYFQDHELPSRFQQLGPPYYSLPDVLNCADLEYERIPPSARDIYIPWFRWLNPRPEPARVAKQLLDRPAAEGSVTVHIRNATDWQNCGRQAPLENFFEAMDQLLISGSAMYVVCHTPEVENQVRERFSPYVGRSLSFMTDKRWSGPGRLADAVTELYRLANSQHLLASYLSTYSEVAWYVGGCRQKVTVVQP